MFMTDSSNQFTWRVIWLLVIIVPESLTETILSPLFPFIVRNALPGIEEESIGHYSGILGSAFYTPLFVMNLVWGAVSDKFGRRPVMFAGIGVYIIAIVVFAFSQNYWILVACRFIAGAFGANSTVVKSMIGSLSSDELSRSWGYALYGSMYGVVGILGPVLGGLLNDPVTLYPNTFGDSTFFKAYPNSLPCLVGAALALVSLYSLVFVVNERDFLDQRVDETVLYDAIELEERVESPEEYEISEQLDRDGDTIEWNTGQGNNRHHRHPFQNELDHLIFEDSRLRLEHTDSFLGQDSLPDVPTLLAPATSKPISSGFRFLAENTLLPIFLYCLIAYVNMTYVTSLPLFYSAPHPEGLGLNSRDSSMLFTFSELTKTIVQIFISNYIIQLCKGIQGTFRYGMALYLPIHAVIPFLTYLTWHPTILFLIATVISLLIGLAESMAYLAVIIFITECTDAAFLGTAHGFAATCAAFVRAIAPTIAGYLWELGLKGSMSWLVFWFGGCISLCGVLSSL